MEIRKSTPEDIDKIMDCINVARQLMRESGNNVQWTNGYPSKELMLESIQKGFNYLNAGLDDIRSSV